MQQCDNSDLPRDWGTGADGARWSFATLRYAAKGGES